MHPYMIQSFQPFFRPGSQWDRLLQTDIVSRDYLDGCYALGQQYADLCASIFLLCEAGPEYNFPRQFFPANQ